MWRRCCSGRTSRSRRAWAAAHSGSKGGLPGAADGPTVCACLCARRCRWTGGICLSVCPCFFHGAHRKSPCVVHRGRTAGISGGTNGTHGMYLYACVGRRGGIKTQLGFDHSSYHTRTVLCWLTHARACPRAHTSTSTRAQHKHGFSFRDLPIVHMSTRSVHAMFAPVFHPFPLPQFHDHTCSAHTVFTALL